jgi:hypothetical protein
MIRNDRTLSDQQITELDLIGLDGGNLLAFLAALGTLRILSHVLTDRNIRLRWRQLAAWTPSLSCDAKLSEDELVSILHKGLMGAAKSPQLSRLGDDLSVPPPEFRKFACDAAAAARPHERAWADFAAAFGCDVSFGDGETIQDTAFRTMSGAGWQFFLKFMRNIAEATTPEHLRKALFEPWNYDDPVENLTLRWDPIDDVRYALRWRNPSGDPGRKKQGSMLGANRLAIEGLPLFPTSPQPRYLATTGFKGSRSTNTYFTWPIWTDAIPLDVIRSVLSLRELQQDSADRTRLSETGIPEIYRSQRITIGKVRNFTPSESVLGP